MSISDFALARSIKQAAAYFEAANELGQAYYVDDGVLKMQADFQPSADYNAAAVEFGFAIWNAVQEALDTTDGDVHFDESGWREAIGDPSMFCHRVANTALWAHRINAAGMADDNEHRLFTTALKSQVAQSGAAV